MKAILYSITKEDMFEQQYHALYHNRLLLLVPYIKLIHDNNPNIS